MARKKKKIDDYIKKKKVPHEDGDYIREAMFSAIMSLENKGTQEDETPQGRSAEILELEGHDEPCEKKEEEEE